MTQNVNAEIIAIGTEILLGEITDTNSVFIARLLRDIGVNVYFMTSVGDNEQRIADSIRLAMSRADVVITCGGLGPTVDDMTRQGVAAATERELVFHQYLLDKIAERFSGFHMQMSENNRRQAFLPADAILIENPVGTAPSFIVEHKGKSIISVPGVPREMKYLMTERVVGYLRERFGLTGQIIKAKVLRTAGIGESTLDDQLGKDLLEGSNPTVGLAAHSGQVDVRITAKADRVEDADAMIADAEARVRERVGEYIFGVDDDTIEGAFAARLREQNGTVAIIETGIAGPVSEPVKRVAGDVVALAQQYAHPDALREVLGVGQDVRLRKLAELAAEAVCNAAGATVGIAVVSHPQMDEHHADAEEGSAIAVYSATRIRSRVYGFGAKSDTAASWTGTWSLSMAWRMLAEVQADAR